jgi:hypothetical protein
MRAAILAAALAAGCAAPMAHVEQGVAYTTGNAAFDEFFAAVKDVRTDAMAGPGDDPYAALISALGLEPKSPVGLAIDEAGARAKKFTDRGVLLHLEFAPEVRVLALKGKGELGLDVEALIKALEDAVKTSLETRRRFATLATRAAELEKKRVDLRAQALVAFRDDKQAKRDEVIAELDASQKVLAGAGEAASKVAGAASRFVVELAQSVETGAGAMLEPSKLAHGKRVAPIAAAPIPVAPPVTGAAPVAAAQPAVKAGPAKGAPPPANAAPPPPKKKAKGGDDFEP